MDEATDIPELLEIDLNGKEQLAILIVATVAGFLAEKYVSKGLTNLVKSRK